MSKRSRRSDNQRVASDNTRYSADSDFIHNDLSFKDPRPLSEIRKVKGARTMWDDDPIIDPRKDYRVFSPVRQQRSNPLIDTRHKLQSIKFAVRHRIVPARQGYDYLNPAHWLVHGRETKECMRRKMRREVGFALKMFGKGKGKGGGRTAQPRRFTERSLIKCRR